MRQSARGRFVISLSFVAAASVLIGASQSLLGNCGPFTDVAADAFCPLILEIFTLGITTGTTATTFDPASNVSRLQMAAFLSRTVDGTLKRAGAPGSPWTVLDAADGARAGANDARRVGPAGPVQRDGPLGGGRRRNGESNPGRRRIAGRDLVGRHERIGGPGRDGRIFVSGLDTSGKLYRIDPSLPTRGRDDARDEPRTRASRPGVRWNEGLECQRWRGVGSDHHPRRVPALDGHDGLVGLQLPGRRRIRREQCLGCGPGRRHAPETQRERSI